MGASSKGYVMSKVMSVERQQGKDREKISPITSETERDKTKLG